MNRPKIDSAPGLAWRPRANGWLAVWVARQDIVKRGFTPETQRLILFDAEPTEDQVKYIQSECRRLQDEMLAFGKSDAAGFNGLMNGLTRSYLTDPESPFHGLRFVTRKGYRRLCSKLDRDCGERSLSALTGRDFRKWYDRWRWPEGSLLPDGRVVKEGPEQAPIAHALITMIRNLLGFGIAFEVEQSLGTAHCARLKAIIGEMEFQKGSPRTETINAQQCADICAAAGRLGLPSIALAQALQFELAIRQKDAIGEWVPMSEPGVSDVTNAQRQKWLYGVRWEEIDGNMILTHKMTKSRKGKEFVFNLSLCPMVMAEIGGTIPASGPMVVCEATGLPWKPTNFRNKWRECANAVGIPRHIQNMDSRAGGTTEAIEATGGDLEAARKQAGHSDSRTTQRYSRDLLKSNSKVAVLRANSRPKTDGERT